MTKHRFERKRMIPSTCIISQFRNSGMNTQDALSELIDNSLDAGASSIKVEFDGQAVRVVDNGSGSQDMNRFVCLAQSNSRASKDKIGRYGVGGKYAQLHFGDYVKVISVSAGRCREIAVDWGKIEDSGDWPHEHDGHSKPSRYAPKDIQDGGTVIEISRPINSRRRYLEVIRNRLDHRYKPALRQGAEIIIGNKGDVPADCRLSVNNEAASLTGEAIGELEGRKFTVIYGQLKEHDSSLYGVHFAFGSRFIVQETRLRGRSLPSRFYAEVFLGPEWKQFLSMDKTKIVSHYEELCDAVATLLSEWIKALDKAAEYAQVEHVNLVLKDIIDNIVVLRPNSAGQFGSFKKARVSDNPGGGDSDVDPDIDEEKAAPNAGDKDSKPKRRRPEGIKFQRDDSLGNLTFLLSIEDDNALTINLNGSIQAIAAAYEHPFKLDVLWPVISYALASFCRINRNSIDQYLPGFIHALNQKGYSVSPDSEEDMEDKVYTFFMRSKPAKISAEKKNDKKRAA